jgi:hypothetical protein
MVMNSFTFADQKLDFFLMSLVKTENALFGSVTLVSPCQTMFLGISFLDVLCCCTELNGNHTKIAQLETWLFQQF